MTQQQYELDLMDMTEEQFQVRYKSTKYLYVKLRAAIALLSDTQVALGEPGPIEIDSDIIQATENLIDDYSTLLEQMHFAAEWENDAAGSH